PRAFRGGSRPNNFHFLPGVLKDYARARAGACGGQSPARRRRRSQRCFSQCLQSGTRSGLSAMICGVGFPALYSDSSSLLTLIPHGAAPFLVSPSTRYPPPPRLPTSLPPLQPTSFFPVET